jgi:hypothetical protein
VHVPVGNTWRHIVHVCKLFEGGSGRVGAFELPVQGVSDLSPLLNHQENLPSFVLLTVLFSENSQKPLFPLSFATEIAQKRQT